jgi:hypothetical protein
MAMIDRKVMKRRSDRRSEGRIGIARFTTTERAVVQAGVDAALGYFAGIRTIVTIEWEEGRGDPGGQITRVRVM